MATKYSCDICDTDTTLDGTRGSISIGTVGDDYLYKYTDVCSTCKRKIQDLIKDMRAPIYKQCGNRREGP